jgi:hypothetical protein
MNRKVAKGAKFFLLLFLIGALVKCATLSFRISLGKQPIGKDNMIPWVMGTNHEL